MFTALVVDDEGLTLQYLGKLLAKEGFEVRTARTLDEARIELEKGVPDLLLVDLVLPDGKGLDLLDEIRSRSALEVVVITGHATDDTAVEALHLGASDYLSKPIDERRLKTIIRNVLRIRGLREEVGDLHQRLRNLGSFGSLVGRSSSIQHVHDLVSKVAPTDATVFITGESGSGKEVVAQTIHEYSQRHRMPFLAVNCGAVTASLIESELFGHEEGSFTGATARRKGHFETADGGTLFLDELAEMPLELQVKLLRVLETGTFLRIGGDREITVDVRVIAATNRPPAEAIADGSLREDLFYRLNVFSIEVPPLRERREDIDLLAAQFLSEFNGEGGTSKRLSRETLELLEKHSWPGNVRELKNVIRRAFIIASDEILPNCLPPGLQECRNHRVPGTVHFEVGTPLAEIERRAVLATLAQHDGNKKKTAEVLGINLRTLYNRLKTYEADGDSRSSREHRGGPSKKGTRRRRTREQRSG